jgi:hypothetical protein
MALPTPAEVETLPIDARLRYHERLSTLPPVGDPSRVQQEALLENFFAQYSAPAPAAAPAVPAPPWEPPIIPQVRSPLPGQGDPEMLRRYISAAKQRVQETLPEGWANIVDAQKKAAILRQAQMEAGLYLDELIGKGAAVSGWQTPHLVKTPEKSGSLTLPGKALDVVQAFGRQPIETPALTALRKKETASSGIYLQRQMEEASIKKEMLPFLMSPYSWTSGTGLSEEEAMTRAKALIDDPSQTQGLRVPSAVRPILGAVRTEQLSLENEYITERITTKL